MTYAMRAVGGIVLIGLVAGCMRTTTLYQPPRVSFTATDTTNVERAIAAGMAQRGWVASREGPGTILGTLHVRAHTVVVRVTYTKDWFQIAYVRSENMDYSRSADGKETIHHNYNAWVDNLADDIDAQLAAPAR